MNSTVRHFKAKLALLSTSHLVNDFMNGVLVAILPLLQSLYGLSVTELTSLVLIGGVFANLIQPLLGVMADKRNRPWFLPFSTLCLGAGVFAMAWSGNFWWLAGSVIISSVGSALYHPDATRTVYLMAPKKRGWAQSIFQIGGNTGMALAPVTLWFLSLSQVGIHGLVWVLVLAFAMGLTMLIFAKDVSLRRDTTTKTGVTSASSVDVKQPISQHASSQKETVHPLNEQARKRGVRLLVTAVACRAITSAGIATFLPLMLIHTYHLTKSEVWIYSFVFSLGGAVGTFAGGPLGDRFGQRQMIQWSLFASIPFAIILLFLHGSAMIVLLIVFGFILLSTFAVTVVYAQDMMPGREAVASSLVIGLTGGISSVSIFLLGILADHIGLYDVLWICLLMPIVGGIVSMGLPKQNRTAKGSVVRAQRA